MARFASTRRMQRDTGAGSARSSRTRSDASGEKQVSRKTRGTVSKAKTSRLFSQPSQIMAPRLLFIMSVAALCVFGLIMVYSASSITAYNDFHDTMYYFVRQGGFIVAGIIVCTVFAAIPYRLLSNRVLFSIAWVLTVAALAATAFGFGVSALGAERSIIIAGFALQPAEFAKISVLIAVASLAQMHSDGELSGKKFVVAIIVATAIPLFLIYRQPDLGTAIILAVGLTTLAALAGISWKLIGAVFGIIIAYVVYSCVSQPYHLQRIISMFDPWIDPQGDGYQSIQSLYAFGSGGIFGTGLGLSRQKYLYLPYAHTDFIFAVVGEELGLFGTVAVVALFGLFIFAGMRICRSAPDMLGCMLAGSMTVMIGFQACVNMACVTGIAPVTGKALPFLSYGGSSLIATMIMVGIILSVSFRSRIDIDYERRRDNFVVYERGALAQGDDVDRHEYANNVISLRRARRERERRENVERTSSYMRISRPERAREQRGGRTVSGSESRGGSSTRIDRRNTASSSGRGTGSRSTGKKKSGGYDDLKPKRNR